jgi:hypothetical protein
MSLFFFSLILKDLVEFVNSKMPEWVAWVGERNKYE